MKKICTFIMALTLLMVMTISASAEVIHPGTLSIDLVESGEYSRKLSVGFATDIVCELSVYAQSARATIKRDPVQNNFSYLVVLHGYYVNPNTHIATNIDRPDSGIDMPELNVYISTASYGAGLLGARAEYSATYLLNTSYTGTVRLPFEY